VTVADYHDSYDSYAEELSSEDRFWLAVLSGLVAALVVAALLAVLYLGAVASDPLLPSGWPLPVNLVLVAIGLAASVAFVALTVAALAIPTYKLLLWALDDRGFEVFADIRHFLNRFFY
jgi:hypothetical protein